MTAPQARRREQERLAKIDEEYEERQKQEEYEVGM